METVISAPELPPRGIEDVPDVSAEFYLDVIRFAETAPPWLRAFSALFTEASLVLLLGLLVITWWRARHHTAHTMAVALLAPVATVVSYLVSECSKTWVQAERPCRTLAVEAIAECPPPGDWAFPSNHATIAGAIAVGVLIAWPRLGMLAMLLGVVAAFSRVFVGAHYPHDTIVGFLLGAVITTVLLVLFVRMVTPQVSRLRENKTIGVFVVASIAAQRHETPPHMRSGGRGVRLSYRRNKT